MKKVINPRLMLIVSMTIFGTLGIFVRNIPVSSGELALYRAILAALLIAIYLIITKQRISFTKIKKEVVTVVCPVLFHERLTGKQILCFIMSTIGLVMITGIGDIGSGSDFIGILFGLGAAVFYATVILLNKFIKNVEGIPRTFLQFLSAIVILIPYVMLSGGMSLGGMNAVGWINLLIVGLVHTGVTYCMYFSSLKELPGQKAAILSYIDPLVAVLISVTILREKMTIWQIAGGVLILGFTLWNEVSPNTKIMGGRNVFSGSDC